MGGIDGRTRKRERERQREFKASSYANIHQTAMLSLYKRGSSIHRFNYNLPVEFPAKCPFLERWTTRPPPNGAWTMFKGTAHESGTPAANMDFIL